MKTPDLRQKLERPDECIDWLGAELKKIGCGKGTKAYKCWQELLVYLAYCEKKVERNYAVIKQLKEVVNNDINKSVKQK